MKKSFWVSAYFQWQTVSFRESKLVSSITNIKPQIFKPEKKRSPGCLGYIGDETLPDPVMWGVLIFHNPSGSR